MSDYATVSIYALVDPFTDEIRYIGKSVRPKERLMNHCNEQSVTYRTNWIRSVLRQGARPILRILEELPADEDWRAAERGWIARGRAAGWPLTNCTDGGDGVEGLPPEIREQMRRTWLGRKHRPETLLKLSAASRGRRHDDAWKRHMHDAMVGRAFSPETRAKISRGVSKLTAEQVAEIRGLLGAGVSQYAIADRFGVHQGTVSNIKRGLFYRDATVPDVVVAR